MRRAVRPGTKLVALSLVSTINGFEHDLKAVCDIAHAAGAYVFADIIHAAGCVPLDLHAAPAIRTIGPSTLAAPYGLRPRPLAPRSTEAERTAHEAFVRGTLKDKAVWLKFGL